MRTSFFEEISTFWRVLARSCGALVAMSAGLLGARRRVSPVVVSAPPNLYPRRKMGPKSSTIAHPKSQTTGHAKRRTTGHPKRQSHHQFTNINITNTNTDNDK